MIFFGLRGLGSRSMRRRAHFFLPSMAEALESRLLPAAGPLGINVELGGYASFVNLLQTTGTWTPAPGASNPVVLNSSGDPESDASLLFDLRVNQYWDGPDPNATSLNMNGTYHLSFNGQATIQVLWPGSSLVFQVQNQVYNASTNTTTADLVVSSTEISNILAIEFTNTQATPTVGLNTGISNAKLIRPGYAANSTQIYTNEFLSALKPYSVLRYLDPEDTNGQPFFNGNTLVTVDAPQVDQTGTPWEYLVSLANQTNTDMWINVPEGATNAYVAAMAGIIKNGGTVNGVGFAGLNSNLKIYLEYSNEVWGGIPNNEYYQQAAVENNASNSPLSTFPSNLHVYDNTDGTTTTDVNAAVGRRYLERTNDIGQIFQGVFGADPTHQKIRPVLGWQEYNDLFYPPAIDWFEHYFGPASSAFYGMGNATYWNPTDYSSVDAVINSLVAQEPAAIQSTTNYTTLATYYGLKNVSYEGGPAISGDGTTAVGQNALAASRDPRMEPLIDQYYLNYYAAGGDLAEFYSGPFGIWSPQNEWPVAELSAYGNPTASSKYRGTVDVANASPVAVTAGNQIAAVGPTSFAATTDTLGESFASPSTGQRDYWLLNIASATTDDLKLTTGAMAGTAPGQVEVFLNDKQIGSVVNVSGSTLVDLGNLTLPAGLNTLSILVVHGSNDPGQSNGSSYQFQPVAFTLMTPPTIVGPAAVADPGFEAVSVGSGFAYNPAGSAWTFSGTYGNGSGVSGNNSPFTSGNPAAPQGTQVAFLQANSSISQSVAGWAAGNDTIAFDAAQRGNYGGVEDFEVLIDGVVISTFKPTGTSYQVYTTSSFAVTAGAHTIKFLGLDSAGGDNTAFLDAVSIAVATTTPPAPPTVGDSGFETVAEGNGGFAYNPAGSAWTFSGSPGNGSGVSGNNSPFTSGNPAAPQGTQVAFLQANSSISQSVAGWAAGNDTIAFDAAQRGNYGGVEDFEVLVDGVVVGTFKPTGTSYQVYTTSSFAVTAGAHTIKFLGLDSAGGDNTAFLDAVSIVVATTTPPAVGDSGFESVVEGNGGFAYNPAGSAWTFSGTYGNGSGLSGNNSPFTSGNSAAPQGTQVAFLQDTGSISQFISGWAAGNDTIAFDAAQRGNYSTSAEDFEVLIDGIVISTFKPMGTSYQAYKTATFTVTAGAHTIKFLGLDSVGGDNTVLIDAVTVQ